MLHILTNGNMGMENTGWKITEKNQTYDYVSQLTSWPY